LGANAPLAPTPGYTGTGTVGGSMSVTPTTTFAPVRGDDFVKRFVAPISLQTVTMVASSGWSVSRVLQLTVDRINHITNAPTATGPTPEHPPDASRFITLTRALRALQLEENLSITVQREGEAESGILYIDEAAETTDPFHTVHELLELPREQTRIRLTEDFTRKAPETLRLRLRSVLGSIFYLSQGVEVPPEHEARGLVNVTRDIEGNRFDWQKVLDGLFRVHWSRTEPARAAVKVYHRDTWFYIAEDDLESKSTFMLLVQLANMQAGRGSLPVPLLTIPAGR
jgi:hypothetical protein